MNPIKASAQHPWTSLIGVVIGFFLLGGLFPLWNDYVLELRDDLAPVVTDWQITNAEIDGDTLTLRGTMVKHRDCLLVPPAVARDSAGTPYKLDSPLWASKAPLPYAQPWGPWVIEHGAHRGLNFVMVYVCGGGRPSIVKVGSYFPQTLVPASGARP